MKRHWISAIALLISGGAIVGCTPPFRAFSTTDVNGAAGPALTTIVDNMLCELRETANSDKKIISDPTRPEVFYTIGDRLYDINYVAMASFDLDVSHTEDLNPSATFTPFAPLKVLNLISWRQTEWRTASIDDGEPFGRFRGIE